MDVVNFFGKNDADAVSFLKNSTVNTAVYDLGYPIAAWQSLGGEFYAYSAFSNEKNEYIEVLALVVAPTAAVINFNCFVRTNDDKQYNGKFRFKYIGGAKNETLNIYQFVCKYLSSQKPKSVTFVNVKKNIKHSLIVRASQKEELQNKIHLTVCVDMTNDSNSFISTNTLLQFFYHYHIIGATEFIVYGSTGITSYIKNQLLRHGIQPNIFPYNFPFEMTSKKSRAIIETDCFLRATNITDYAITVSINEYLLPFAAKFKPNTEFYSFIDQYSKDTTRFEVNVRNVCLNSNNNLLSVNNLAEVMPADTKFYLQRLNSNNNNNFKIIALESKKLVLNRYIYCSEKNNIFDWKSLIDQKSLNYFNTISHQLNIYLTQ